MSDKVIIDFDASSARKAADEAGKLKLSINEATDSTKKLTAATEDTAKAAESSHGSHRESLNKLAGAYTDTRNKIMDAVGVARGFADLLIEHDKEERALRSLGTAYAEVTAATQGTVTAQQAVLVQQTLAQAGMTLQAGQLGTITRAAREYAIATGTDVQQALGQMTDALRTGSSEGLGRFGIAIDSTHGALQNMDDGLRRLAETQSRAAPAARTLSEEVTTLGHELNVLGGVLAAGLVTKMGELYSWWARINGVGGGFLQQARELGRWVSGQEGTELRGANARFNERGDTRLRQREQLMAYARTHNVGSFETTGRTDAQLAEMLDVAQNGGESEFRALVNGQNSSNQDARDLAAVNANRDTMVATFQRDAAQTTRRASYRRGGSGGGSARSRTATADTRRFHSVDEIFEEMRASILRDIEAERANDVIAMQGASDRGEATRADRFTRQSGMRSFAQTQAGKAANERRTSFGGVAAEAAGMATNEDGTIKTFDVMNDSAKILGQTIGTLKSGVAELFGTLASGTMSAGDAFAQFGLKMLKSLGDVFINQGVGFIFQGIAALATGNPGGAITLGAGAGMIALGAGMGGIAAVATPSAGGAAAAGDTSRASSLSPKSVGGKGEQGGALTVVVSSLVPAGVSDVARMRDAGRQQRRVFQADTNIVPRRLEY